MDDTTSHARPEWRATWFTGPDAGASTSLHTGVHVVGRAPGAVGRTSAPALEPHHLRIEVHADGTVSVLQLTGATRITIDGRHTTGTVHRKGFTWIACAGGLLALHPAAPAGGTTPAHPPDVRVVVRRPRVLPDGDAPLVTEPPPAPPLDMTGTIGGLLASVVLAVLTGHPALLLVGVVGTITPRLVGRWRRFRSDRRTRQLLDRHDATQRTRLFTQLPNLVTTLDVLRHRDDRLWSRRITDGDAHVATVGLGDVDVPAPQRQQAHPGSSGPPVGERRTIRGVPVPIDLGPGARLALTGPYDVAVAHALVAQLLTWTGPADLQVLLHTDRPRRWSALTGVPHVRRTDDEHLTEDLADLGDVHVVVVSDRVPSLVTRSSALREALSDPTRTALVAVLGDSSPPRPCTSVLHTRPDGSAHWSPDTADARVLTIHFAGLDPERARRALAPLHELQDPEAATTDRQRLPNALDLMTITASTPASILERWSRSPHPTATIGCTVDGPLVVDLVRDGPHALIAGTTGAGKSELLRTIVLGLAVDAPPDRLAFVLVDYKGGAAFDAVRALPHVVGLVTDLDDDLTDRMLRSLRAELRSRERILRDHDVTDLATLHDTRSDVVLPRLVVIVDEFAALVADRPDFLHALVGVAQRGRSLGVHLVLATQRPQGVVSDDVRANTDLRVALRLLDAAESIDVIGTPAAAHLPRRSPGRGLVRIDGHVTMFQTAMCTNTTSLVEAVVDATATGARPLPRAPWCPPLPSLLRRADLPAGAIGLLDLPDLQQVQPLQWAPGDGGVLVSAAARRGATTALQLLAANALEFGHRVYVLDGGGDARWSTWVSHPRFGGAVPIVDHERLWRLLHHCTGAPAVLVVDRLDTVRSVLDDPSTFTAASALDRLLADPAVTLVASVVDEHSLPARLGARVTHHWRLTGVGRMSMEDGTHAQLAIDPQVPPVDPADRTPVAPPVEPIPRRLRIDRLPTHRDGRPALGLGVPSGEPIHLSLRPGEHLLVLGAPRTGRTSALATVSVVWRAVLPGHPLVVVDDADSVDDSDGSLARLASDGRTTIIAAARPDALRTQYGHWTTILRRSRSGLVAAGGSELDGDLLGQILPRTLPAPPRPGLMWLVADGTASLLQVAQG